ncbi:hypothetical protein ACIRST_41930 [Kitasatospora sp. NPDC101447]|uniref:hypothetical protein n=1 Tax=Kitasatospora sp. NPDC101447 TaxID=3364102 RepID=UPI003818C8FD
MNDQRQPELKLSYGGGWQHFVLYTEPGMGAAMSGLNGTVSVERDSRYTQEWLRRLVPCEPNPLHTLLVGNDTIPKLFHPCVYTDPESPSAVGGSGCVCYQTFYDPEYGLPVVADHYRTVSGNIETWTRTTYAPYALREEDSFASFIIDGGDLFWLRTRAGILSLLPESRSGYGIGYGGGGPTQLASYIQQLLDTDGQNTTAQSGWGNADKQILDWARDPANKNLTQELTLQDLRRIQRS